LITNYNRTQLFQPNWASSVQSRTIEGGMYLALPTTSQVQWL